MCLKTYGSNFANAPAALLVLLSVSLSHLAYRPYTSLTPDISPLPRPTSDFLVLLCTRNLPCFATSKYTAPYGTGLPAAASRTSRVYPGLPAPPGLAGPGTARAYCPGLPGYKPGARVGRQEHKPGLPVYTGPYHASAREHNCINCHAPLDRQRSAQRHNELQRPKELQWTVWKVQNSYLPARARWAAFQKKCVRFHWGGYFASVRVVTWRPGVWRCSGCVVGALVGECRSAVVNCRKR